MLTAMMAIWNMQGAAHEIWAVNTDFEYHETQQLETSETAGFARDIEVSEAGTWLLAGRAIATNGPDLASRFAASPADRLVVPVRHSVSQGAPTASATQVRFAASERRTMRNGT